MLILSCSSPYLCQYTLGQWRLTYMTKSIHLSHVLLGALFACCKSKSMQAGRLTSIIYVLGWQTSDTINNSPPRRVHIPESSCSVKVFCWTDNTETGCRILQRKQNSQSEGTLPSFRTTTLSLDHLRLLSLSVSVF